MISRIGTCKEDLRTLRWKATDRAEWQRVVRHAIDTNGSPRDLAHRVKQEEDSDASSKKFEVGIEKVNHDAVDTSSKNLKVSRKRSTRSTSDTSAEFIASIWRCKKISASFNVTRCRENCCLLLVS